MPDIEFVDDEPGDVRTPRDRPPSRVDRRLLLVIVALVAILIAVVAVTRHGSGGRPSADRPTQLPSLSSTPGSSTPGSSTPGGQQLPVQGRSAEVTIDAALPVGDPSAAVLDVSVSATTRWVLQADRLYEVIGAPGTDAADQHTLRSVAVGAGGYRSSHVEVDAAHGLVWLALFDDAGARVIAYRTSTLLRVGGVIVRPALSDAAALDGRLYVTSGRKLLAITPGGQVTTASTAPYALGDVLADPFHHRVIAVSAAGATNSQLWGYVPGHVAGFDVPTGVSDASLAVTGTGQVWLADAASLRHLNADTLRPYVELLSNRVGTTLVAGGQDVLWARVTDGESSGLVCLDASTGAEQEQWQIGGTVASAAGSALVATSTGAHPLVLKGCRG